MKALFTSFRKLCLILFFLVTPAIVFAQSAAKQFYKAAVKSREAGNYTEAVGHISTAIQLKPDEPDYYKERIYSYEKLNNFGTAAEDYLTLISFEKKPEHYLNAGKCYFRLKNYLEAKNMFNSAILLNKKYVEAYQQMALTKLNSRDFKGALSDCNIAIDFDKDNFVSYYVKGQALDSLGDLTSAIAAYSKAIELGKEARVEKLAVKPDLKEYHISIGTASNNAGKLNDAMYYYNIVLENYGRDDAMVYYLRGIAYFRSSDFQNALNDFNKSIFLSDKNPKVFFERGIVNQRLNNYQNAIDDFSRSLSLNPNETASLKARGISYESAGRFEEAIKDYQTLLGIEQGNEEMKMLMASARNKLFEKNREGIPPVASLTIPLPDENNVIRVPDNKEVFTFSGKIKDDNLLKSISVNGADASFDLTKLNPSYKADIKIALTDSLVIKATDVYGNSSVVAYSIVRTESNPPLVILKTPFSTPDKEVFLDADKKQLYIEGQVEDASIIQFITVEGISASFELNKLNPAFSVTVGNVDKTDTIHITVADKFNNVQTAKYIIRRESAASADANPMGRTWIVFIENSNYRNLQSLEGPANDVLLMKTTFANYRIHKTIHKKDLTKHDLDKFFSIELRDQVKNNQVNSLLVWFAGHGRFMNETGYWIPVDGSRDEESTLFNLNTLRAYMQSYSNVVHTLVVSDACESGPAFYVAMRDIPEDKKCDDWNNTKFHSAQVLTSSNAETASDQSVFTKTFARTLSQNPEGCIPIEKIAVKVTQAVKQNQKQYPKFGKIQGLIDENGTFFFIKK